jgi:hypothetical protein
MNRLSRQCEILDISQSYGPSRPATGIALLLIFLSFHFTFFVFIVCVLCFIWAWRVILCDVCICVLYLRKKKTHVQFKIIIIIIIPFPLSFTDFRSSQNRKIRLGLFWVCSLIKLIWFSWHFIEIIKPPLFTTISYRIFIVHVSYCMFRLYISHLQLYHV